MEFPSEDWISRLGEAAASLAVDPAVELSIDYFVGEFGYRLIIAAGSVRVTTDLDGDADVRIRADVPTATAIRDGRSALEGFMKGDVVVGGDLQKIMEHQGLLEGLGDVFQRVATLPETTAG